MDVQLLTFAKPVLQVEIDHMDCVRIPDCLAGIVKHRLGAPYESTETMGRWSAMFVVPMPMSAPYPAPFELVCCTRGSSIRCHWQDRALILELMDRMVPELIAIEIVPTMEIAA